jgi:hypothetical protein
MRFPEGFDGNFDNIPDEWEPEELFTHGFFVQEVKKIFPDIDDADANWLILEEKTFSLEFNMGDGDPVNSIMLHVRGSSEAVKAIGLLCGKFNLQAVDTTESKIIRLVQ